MLPKKGSGSGAEGASIVQLMPAASGSVLESKRSSVQDKTFELLEACKHPDQVVNCRPSVRQYGVLHQAAFHGDIEVRVLQSLFDL